LEFAFVEFPVFNVADCFVVVGAVLLAIQVLFLEKGE
jgi:signal peptidase II